MTYVNRCNLLARLKASSMALLRDHGKQNQGRTVRFRSPRLPVAQCRGTETELRGEYCLDQSRFPPLLCSCRTSTVGTRPP